MSDGRIEITREGLFEPDGEAKIHLRPSAGSYDLVVTGPQLIVLRSTGQARVQMAGEILTRMSVMEMINIIATSNWIGELHVHSADANRVLAFDKGALKGASSNASDDRLGEVLYRAGVLSREQIEELALEMGSKRFGELAVEKGYVDQQGLFEQLQLQAREIFFAALLMHEGVYTFIVGDDEGDTGATVHLSVQGLLMEGVQRIDEMALFQDKVPNLDMCPVRSLDAPDPKKLDGDALTVLAACDGERSINEIARETGLGEFLTTKSVYQLIQAKQITLHTSRKIDVAQVNALIARFNEVMQDIFVAVATYGGLSQTRATLEAWIEGSGYGPFFGEGVDELGTIDAAFVAEALKGADTDHPIEALHQALHELAAFALFSATTALPRDQELTLARDVNARLKAIRLS